MISLPQNAKYAVFSHDHTDGCVRSKDGLRWKRPKNAYAPLMVHEKLLYPDSFQPENEIDGFFKEMLLISGGYTGRRIFAGMDPANTGRAVLDNCYQVKDDATTRFRIRNPHRITKATKNIIFGDDYSDSDDDDEVGDGAPPKTLFPSHQEWLEFDERSNIERVVASAAHARVPLQPEIQAVFETAYEKYR
jgi:hypothetical protein